MRDCKHIHTLISRHLQRALYMPFRAQHFRFRVVLAQRLLKVKPFTSLPPMALLLRCFLIQIRITIKPVLTRAFFLFSCRFEYVFAQSDSLLRWVAHAWARLLSEASGCCNQSCFCISIQRYYHFQGKLPERFRIILNSDFRFWPVAMLNFTRAKNSLSAAKVKRI